MKFSIGSILAAAIVTAVVSTAASAQTAKPTYEGDPDVYKLVFEDANFRVIKVLRKKGVHDKAHGHPSPAIVYNITDCTTKQYSPDGKSAENTRKAGTASAVAIVASHSAENTGPADCEQVFVEKK
jgi:hypothetical protein